MRATHKVNRRRALKLNTRVIHSVTCRDKQDAFSELVYIYCICEQVLLVSSGAMQKVIVQCCFFGHKENSGGG